MMFRAYLIFFICFIHFSCVAQIGIIDRIDIQGTTRTKPSFLRNLVDIREGVVLDSNLLAADITLLKRLPSISNANYSVLRTASGNYEVTYKIQENYTLIPFANLFASSNDDFAFRIGLQEFNVLGRNITVGGFYQYDIFHSYGIGLRAPYLFSKKMGISIQHQDFTTQEPVFFENATADYRYGNRGTEIMGLYQFSLKNRIEIGGSKFAETYQYLQGATSQEVPQELEVKKYLFKLIYSFDSVEYFYQYLEGFRSILNFQVVGSTDENLPGFLIGFNDFIYFRRLGDRGNWANRIRLGLASNVNTPFAPFTVDNNLNIRGVGNRIDRGTGAIVFNTEYRYTLMDVNWFVLQGNLFIDGGSWRNPGGDLGDFADKRNIRIYPGVGLRIMHKHIFNAIFRIDYGYGVTKDASHGVVFGIGQFF